MKKLLIALIALLALASAGGLTVDLLARQAAEDRLREELAAEVPEAREVTATVESFPFLPPLLMSGRVQRISAELRDYRRPDVELSSVHLVVEGLQLDRGILLQGKRLVVTGIERARVEVQIDEGSLSRLLGLPVTLEPGVLLVEVGGRTVEAGVRVDDRRVRIQVAGVATVSLSLPDRDLLPCSPRIRIRDGILGAQCELDRLPRALAAGLAGP